MLTAREGILLKLVELLLQIDVRVTEFSIIGH